MADFEISKKEGLCFNYLYLTLFLSIYSIIWLFCVYSRLLQPLSISMIDLLIFSIFPGISSIFILIFLLLLHMNLVGVNLVGFQSIWVFWLKLYLGSFFFFWYMIHFLNEIINFSFFFFFLEWYFVYVTFLFLFLNDIKWTTR